VEKSQVDNSAARGCHVNGSLAREELKACLNIHRPAGKKIAWNMFKNQLYEKAPVEKH